jgi:hypothetical protein
MISRAQRSMKRETSFLGDAKRPMMPERANPKTGLLAPPWRLLMQIGGDNQTTVGMEVRDQIILGRTDPLADYHPDLDLTPYGGQENGVSRRHLSIVQGDKALYVKDLGATNGTRINGFQLDPNQLYRLRDGDELELGRVRITVRFVRSPY